MWYHAGGGGDGFVASLALVYLFCWLMLTEQGYCDIKTQRRKSGCAGLRDLNWSKECGKTFEILECTIRWRIRNISKKVLDGARGREPKTKG